MPTSRTDAEAGFTLLELLVVLVILALSATAVLWAGSRSTETARVRSFLINTEALFRDARTEAIESRTATDVVVDTEARRLSLGGTRAVDVPKGVTLQAQLAQLAQVEGEKTPRVRFYPSGGSTGGILSFNYRGRIYEIRVNWLTGRTDAQAL